MGYHSTLESSEILATEIQALIHDDKSHAQCLELVAQAYGYSSYGLMKAALATGQDARQQSRLDAIQQFWQSPRLSEFITDYACRRQPVVLAFSSENSLIIAQSAPSAVFEIAATPHGFTLFDLGLGPYLPQSANHFRIPLDSYATVAEAFGVLAQTQNWEW